MTPRVTAAIIVKDEAEHLRACLTSLVGVADEVVIVDTGSTDHTVAVAESFGAVVLHRPWDGRFSPPRNLGLDHATGDWILYIDADERVLPLDGEAFHAELARATAAGIISLQLRFHPRLDATAYYEFRLWQHRPEIRFEGVMHEGVAQALVRCAAAHGMTFENTDAIAIEHHGYEGDQTAKHHRNLPLLLAELERTPERVYLWDHLGRVHKGLGDTDAARAAWHRGLELVRARTSGDSGDVAGVMARQIDSLPYCDLIGEMIESGEDVAELLAEGMERFPGHPHLRWLVAVDALARGDHELARTTAESLLAYDERTTVSTGLSFDRRIFGELAHHLVGVCHADAGRWDRALEHFEGALARVPDSQEYRVKVLLARARAGQPDRVA